MCLLPVIILIYSGLEFVLCCDINIDCMGKKAFLGFNHNFKLFFFTAMICVPEILI